jgi:hypothetical protein
MSFKNPDKLKKKKNKTVKIIIAPKVSKKEKPKSPDKIDGKSKN